jgi:hypothetical protein
LALTSLTSGGRSVGIVRLRAKATEFFFFIPLTKISKFLLHQRNYNLTAMINKGKRKILKKPNYAMKNKKAKKPDILED